ncbi:MAG: 4-hydroxy-3-methylbut-2-enyl diphosphate reductase [candidate division KSB1 bacterium]|nr:4-hydroxy-3-methylbut-2-enyl diphosphate reductase [candidate division KSB1 bacterium]
MNIIIDPHAGPCPGVERAIEMVEKHLDSERLTAIGPIIHNSVEVKRLEQKGLSTVEQDQVNDNRNLIQTNSVFIRSHGISSDLRTKLKKCADIIDGTCPKVTAIQKRIQSYYDKGYHIIITGKENHPEVEGLNGYCDGNATIIKNESDIESIPESEHYFLLSQTTFSQARFLELKEAVLSKFPNTEYKDTTCTQVRKRHETIHQFAATVDVLLLVGGKNSSNTRVLYNRARQINPRTYWIERFEEIDEIWLENSSTVGLTGSASTPVWQLLELQNKVSQLGLKKEE